MSPEGEIEVTFVLGSLLIYKRYIERPLFQIFAYVISWDPSLAGEG